MFSWSRRDSVWLWCFLSSNSILPGLTAATSSQCSRPRPCRPKNSVFDPQASIHPHMIKKILVVLAVAVVVILVVAAFQPADYRVARTISIAAPARLAFVQVNDFHAWANWSPWEKLDPAMKRTYEGPP